MSHTESGVIQVCVPTQSKVKLLTRESSESDVHCLNYPIQLKTFRLPAVSTSVHQLWQYLQAVVLKPQRHQKIERIKTMILFIFLSFLPPAVTAVVNNSNIYWITPGYHIQIEDHDQIL